MYYVHPDTLSTIYLYIRLCQDIEVWTDVHPDTLSAPELQQLVQKSKQKIIQVK